MRLPKHVSILANDQLHELLSIYAIAEQTYVDGICLFDLQRDLELRQQNLKERMRIIKKMIADKNEKKQKPKKEKEKLYHCETLEP